MAEGKLLCLIATATIMLNTLYLAERASYRARAFMELLFFTCPKPIFNFNLISPIYSSRDMRHAFLQGYLAALEELRRASSLEAETVSERGVQAR